MFERSICNLHELPVDKVEEFGGKATNLSLLYRLGVKIPNGFAISGHYFIDAIEKSPTTLEMMKRLDQVDDFEEILDIASNLQVDISKLQFPSGMVNGIKERFSYLNEQTNAHHGYAVRSSASIEDAKDFSFAGQAETYLCIKNLADILSSVKNVWKSAISPQAAIYLKAKGVPISRMRMGVVIQEMIVTDVSGVLFTVNVVDNNRDQMLIESTWGLGESLVGGNVIPDSYIVEQQSKRILSRNLGSKEFTFVHGDGCTVRLETSLSKRNQFTLTDDQLTTLVKLGTRIEQEMGCPQDIEWCLRGDEITVLQSRPITTLKD